MSRAPAIGEDQRADFTRRWQAGETLDKIAAVYGVSRPTVSQTAMRFGLPSRNARGWTAAGRGQQRPKVDPYALVGGAWVTGPDRIARWIPGAQS